MKRFLDSLSAANKLLIFLLVVTLAALGYVLWQYQTQAERPETYSAVFMNTGDLYFGRLRLFPSLSLSDVYLLQRNPNDAQNPLSLAKFTNVFWGPTDRLELNRANVVWMTTLDPKSQVIQTINAIKAGLAIPPAEKAGSTSSPQAGGVAAPVEQP